MSANLSSGDNNNSGEPCPIKGLTFASEWAGTSIHLQSQPVSDCVEQLYPEELAVIANAAQLRRNTFSSGRSCARAVMEQAGLHACALPKRDDGSVDWPTGILGSVSHTNDWAVAAVAVRDMCEAQSIGVDLERIKPLDEGVIKLIATPVEREELQASSSPLWHPTALFSLKESVYKCLARDFGQFIGFHDVQITGVAGARPVLNFCREALAERYQPSRLQLRMEITAQHVFTLVWLRVN